MFSVRMLQRATFPILAGLAMDFASAWGTNPSTSETAPCIEIPTLRECVPIPLASECDAGRPGHVEDEDVNAGGGRTPIELFLTGVSSFDASTTSLVRSLVTLV